MLNYSMLNYFTPHSTFFIGLPTIPHSTFHTQHSTFIIGSADHSTFNMLELELPVLVGISRKSMIFKLIGGDPTTSLNGTTALNTISLMKGASILRVHDVREAVEVCKIAERF